MSVDEVKPIEAEAADENAVAPRGTHLASTQTITHEYLTQSGKVMRETVTTNQTVTAVMDFVYDESGKPFALNYSTNGGSSFTTYYYVLNLQGDVVKLIDQDGAVAAAYAYDAWGNILSSSGSMAEKNPLRYRGYYHDSETGFYYLQSRYYDPATRRFINADVYASTDSRDAVSCNMFAYCNNNPVNRTDAEGNWSLPNWAKVAIGAVALAGAVALTVATGGGAAAVAVGVAKVVGSVAVSTAVSAGVGYLNNGKQGSIDGACNGFMFGSLSACGGAALKYVSSAANKASVATSLSEPKTVANTITGYTKHGLNQAIGRNGVWVKPSAILDAVRNPVDVVTKIDKLGRISTQYRGAQSTVVLNELGKVVSCWAKSSKYWRI